MTATDRVVDAVTIEPAEASVGLPKLRGGLIVVAVGPVRAVSKLVEAVTEFFDVVVEPVEVVERSLGFADVDPGLVEISSESNGTVDWLVEEVDLDTSNSELTARLVEVITEVA